MRSFCRELTGAVGAHFVGVGLGSERRSWLELAVRVLGEVRHHGQLVHLRVAHLNRLDQLRAESKEDNGENY